MPDMMAMEEKRKAIKKQMHVEGVHTSLRVNLISCSLTKWPKWSSESVPGKDSRMRVPFV